MMIWASLGGVAALAVLCLAWPLLRRAPRAAADPGLDIYRQQLAELAADQASGSLPAAEAEAAALEIQRRLLRAGEAAKSVNARRLPPLAVLGLAVALVLAAAALYGAIGRPLLGSPAPAADAARDGALDPLLAKLRDHLGAHGGDRKGWEMLARGESMLGRGALAADALAHAAALDPGNADLRVELGEALVVAAEGRVTPAASLAFRQALALQPGLPAARYYLGLALVQQNKLAEGRAIWADVVANAPADAPWRPQMQQKLAALDARMNVQSMASSVAQMDEAQQAEFVRGMVARLAARLQAQPNDPDGWEKLGQAQSVLGDREQARNSFGRAMALRDKSGPDYARLARARAALDRK